LLRDLQRDYTGAFRLFEGSKQILAHTEPPLSDENIVQDKLVGFVILWCPLGKHFRAVAYIDTFLQMLYTLRVEYPFPPVGIVGAADGKNRRAFFFPDHILLCILNSEA
jgi:hypothetical protein